MARNLTRNLISISSSPSRRNPRVEGKTTDIPNIGLSFFSSSEHSFSFRSLAGVSASFESPNESVSRSYLRWRKVLAFDELNWPIWIFVRPFDMWFAGPDPVKCSYAAIRPTNERTKTSTPKSSNKVGFRPFLNTTSTIAWVRLNAFFSDEVVNKRANLLRIYITWSRQWSCGWATSTYCRRDSSQPAPRTLRGYFPLRTKPAMFGGDLLPLLDFNRREINSYFLGDRK